MHDVLGRPEESSTLFRLDAIDGETGGGATGHRANFNDLGVNSE